ncbi:MAG: EMC3/TMCO1 family protein [Candidatus Hodarchaeaceae archaeon]|nr:EMC3/TMCO1 family protein [Candidatus Hodarchaeaceae archaeon]
MKLVRRIFVISFIVGLLLCAGFTTASSQQVAKGDQETLWHLLNRIDSSIIALRRGDSAGAQSALGEAFALYKNMSENKFENDDLDNYIKQAFTSLQRSPREDNIRTLRADISLIAGKLDIVLPFIYERAIFFILLLAVIFSLVITLITKKVVNWAKVKQVKAEVDAWRKELMDAQRKKDMKRIYKLQQDQKRIYGLQGQMMMETFKPAIIYIVPYFIFWYWLSSLYKGWVVAWLPFSLPLPFYGLWASCGFLSWFLVSYFGFSSIWRKLFIGD